MKKSVFLNCTQHSLLPEQIQEAKKLAGEILDIKDFPIFEEIKNSASELQLLRLQAGTLVDFLDVLTEQYEKVYVHLPIGSPAFQAILMRSLVGHEGIIPVFSHTDREVVEEKAQDGAIIKKNVFRFKKYILLEGI